ncbi:hypothetical protein OZX57_04425 [Bifidobacterium sp. ESL0682]|nr:hypothetical protein [Bifidobacterium sp. ESL0682]WEV42650.1 hypothetical protein OZX57_04425 [Bifidobacterium sp. ESL0682]
MRSTPRWMSYGSNAPRANGGGRAWPNGDPSDPKMLAWCYFTIV